MKSVKDMKATKNQTTDPVCGMAVDPETALHAERGGQTAYFCSEACRKQWLAIPANAAPTAKSNGKSPNSKAGKVRA